MSGYGAYKKASITTASPGQILIMLYEAAIKHLKKAQACIDAKDIPGKGLAIGKVTDIVNELNATLNFEVGGQVAKDLEALYNFITNELLKANLNNDKEQLGRVIKILENLLEGWRGAVSQVMKEQKEPAGK